MKSILTLQLLSLPLSRLLILSSQFSPCQIHFGSQSFFLTAFSIPCSFYTAKVAHFSYEFYSSQLSFLAISRVLMSFNARFCILVDSSSIMLMRSLSHVGCSLRLNGLDCTVTFTTSSTSSQLPTTLLFLQTLCLIISMKTRGTSLYIKFHRPSSKFCLIIFDDCLS